LKGGNDMPITQLKDTDYEIRDVVIAANAVIFVELDGTQKLVARLAEDNRGAKAASKAMEHFLQTKKQQAAPVVEVVRERKKPGRKPGSKNKPKEAPAPVAAQPQAEAPVVESTAPAPAPTPAPAAPQAEAPQQQAA